MVKQLTKLKPTTVNKTIVFYSPLEGKDDVFVRTGIVKDENSFYHALLYAYSKDYVSMDTKGRIKFVNRLCASLVDKIDKDSWEGIGGGIIAKAPFQEKLQSILLNFYRFIASDDRARGKSIGTIVKSLVGEDENNLEYIKLITEMIPLETIENHILPRVYDDCIDKRIEECKKGIQKQVRSKLDSIEELKSLDSRRSKHIYSLASNMFRYILDEAEDSAFNTYVINLQKRSNKVDLSTVEIISNRFNRDIYFIDAQTRMPSENDFQTALEGRKSIIVMSLSKNRYEIVGRLLPGNRIQREFDEDDPIIQKLRTFLLSPRQISDKYPELTPYLPKEFRHDASPSRSSIRSSSSSDSSSDSDSE